MDPERPRSLVLFLVLLVAGAGAWFLHLQPALEIDTSALATLPRHLGPWRSRELPLDSGVESVLRADFNLQRVYSDPSGQTVWIYVGYYGTERGGRPEHVPRGCYTGAGWDITSSRIVEDSGARSLRVQEYVVEREGERRLVHFWYRSHRRTGMIGGLDQNLDRLLGRLTLGRADGALVRISTPLEEEDPVLARSRLMSFASRLDPALAERWPLEMPAVTEG